MFERQPNPVTLRGCMATMCLALLFGCVPAGPKGASATIPVVPVDLSATPGNAQVSLTWTASSGATSYNVKRATATGGPYTQVAASTAASYTDTSLTNGTTYYYVVSALNAVGESANSAQVSATPAAPITIPAVPAGVTATAGNAQVGLTWTASSGATSYHVKRATTSGGPYTQIAAPTTAAYTDTTVTNGTTYYYVVSALNTAGESANSAQVSALPTAPTVNIPAVPTGVTATAGNAQVGLTWTASSGATSYHVKRATTSGGPYTQIAAPTTAAYTDTTVTNGTTYYYVVSALNTAGESANSAQVSALPSAPVSNFGVWTDVTPPGVDLTSELCSNFGAKTISQDPGHPSNLFTSFDCQGIWKSTDYGVTWTGPINTGTNAAAVSACSGGLAIAPNNATNVATLYQSCIRGGDGLGFWKSVDAGVNWTQITVTPTSRQDYFHPVVDPHDPNHLLMDGHEFVSVVQSVDGGLTWTSVNLDSGMQHTGAIFFIDTGDAATTRQTWLWIGDPSGGTFGTWRTVNGGTTWTQVDKNESIANAEIYQPDTGGVLYMAGNYSVFGSGVLRSTDYGQTWSHVGNTDIELVVTGTPKNVYSMYGYPVGAGGSVNPAFEIATQPGNGTWVEPGTPAGINQGGAAQITVVNDGTHNILVGAMWNGGVWRYVEP